MKKVRHIIGFVSFPLGMLICLGAVGRLDFLAENASIEAADELTSVIRALIGIVFMGVSVGLNYDTEFKEK
ncbi:MAG: hypothetical protein NC401_18135 [Ruminococcus sp.]|nr:hypothetical protein [Ruminococcus sp.]